MWLCAIRRHTLPGLSDARTGMEWSPVRYIMIFVWGWMERVNLRLKAGASGRRTDEQGLPMAKEIRILLMKMITTFYRRALVVAAPSMIRSLNRTFASDRHYPAERGGRPAYIQLRPDQDPNVIAMRLANGDQCFAVWHEGRIVHTGWCRRNISMNLIFGAR